MPTVTVNAGQDLTADDLSQYATLTAPWQTYSPEWTAASGTTTLGDGTLTGGYQQVGSTYHFAILFQWGSTTTQSVSGANWQFSVPVPVLTSFGSTFWFVDAWLLDTNISTRYLARGYINTSSLINTIVVDGSAATIDDVTPFTWAVGDRLNIKGTFCAAS